MTDVAFWTCARDEAQAEMNAVQAALVRASSLPSNATLGAYKDQLAAIEENWRRARELAMAALQQLAVP
jgi:hypothetical protein